MSLRIDANCEPIPGYRLIERIGGGGFGEVWKAERRAGCTRQSRSFTAIFALSMRMALGTRNRNCGR